MDTACTLKEFIDDTLIIFNTDNIYFNLMRWSKEQPYWCIFIYDTNNFIGGHYCLDLNANLHEVLNCIISSNLKCIITNDFFK